MRKSRGKYKVSGRLGYNAMLRRWSGTKKKWENHVMYSKPNAKRDHSERDTGRKGNHVRNPIGRLKNEERIGTSLGEKKESGSRIRRKDRHGRQQSQKTGRKRIYGGVSGGKIEKDRSKQRKAYKEWKQETDRNYRKGRLISETEEVEKRTIVDKATKREENQSTSEKREYVQRKRQKEQTHRIAKTEIRADVRRWRSGRVPTLQMARDLIEHDYVNRVDEEGNRKEVVKWQCAEMKVGSGRKVNEKVWKNIKGRAREVVKKDEYQMIGVNFIEVDYVTGRRMVLRKPESGEVGIPMGREVSLWTYL